MLLKTLAAIADVPCIDPAELDHLDLNQWEIEVVARFCWISRLDPKSLNQNLAEALLSVSYTLSSEDRGSAERLAAQLCFATQALTLLQRAEVQAFAKANPQAASRLRELLAVLVEEAQNTAAVLGGRL